MTIEVMKQALAALQDFNEQSKPPLGVPLPAEIDAAMETLTKAIEQYESAKPAAWLNLHEGEQSEYVLEWCKDPKCTVSKPLYTAHTVPEGWNAKHLKTGAIYQVVGEAINATDAQDGQGMVIYRRDGVTFVREVHEFMEKFAAEEVK